MAEIMSAATHVAAAGNLRPHCRNAGACVAKTPGKHCNRCAAGSPEVRARKRAGVAAALQRPEVRANKADAARRVAADAEITARKTIKMRAAYQRQDVKERHQAGCVRGALARLSDPSKAEAMRQLGLTVGVRNLTRALSPDARARQAAALRAAHLAWCPPEYWALNEQLKRRGLRLAARQAEIAAQIERANLAKLDHELAAAHLRRLGALFRCDAAGKPHPFGSHYRFGTRVLARIDIVRLAIQKGALPEALAA